MSAIDQPRLLQDKIKELRRMLRQALHQFKLVTGIDLLHIQRDARETTQI